MRALHRDILRLGGIASRDELFGLGHRRESIEIGLMHRTVIRVRQGWYALPDEPPDIVRAWRVGGRLACRSALALLTGEPSKDGLLHVEVPRNAVRLRSPDDAARRLSRSDPVIVHWTGEPLDEVRRMVAHEDALAQAGSCGIRYSLRQGSSPAAPPSGLSPPRRR